MSEGLLAALGPAPVDIVRFLGSIDLVARERGWSHDRDRTFDRFFDGYRKGMSDPAYQPPEPDVVRRHKAATTSTTDVTLITRPPFPCATI